MVNILRQLYDETNTKAWCHDGDVTEEFTSTMGVKQGCLLSPLLFALFTNDIVDHLRGGISIAGKKINILAYAADIVLPAASMVELQEMVNCLAQYCHLRNLQIDLKKSKIMVFRNGGKLAKNDRWYLGEKEIEVANEYKYMRVVLTPCISFVKHF